MISVNGTHSCRNKAAFSKLFRRGVDPRGITCEYDTGAGLDPGALEVGLLPNHQAPGGLGKRQGVIHFQDIFSPFFCSPLQYFTCAFNFYSLLVFCDERTNFTDLN